MSKHQDITLLHFAYETLSELSEHYENIKKEYDAIRKKIKSAEITQKHIPKYSIVVQDLRDDALYYKHSMSHISLLLECARKLAGHIEHNEISNATLLSGEKVDKELQDLQELPDDYMNPDEREQQRQDFQELP